LTDPASVLEETRSALAGLPNVLRTLIGELDEATARSRPAAHEWSPVEILCHLRDEETEDFAARLRVILDGRKEFAPIDPEGWVEARSYRQADPRRALTEFCESRATLELLATITPERLRASVEHRRLGALSGLDLLVSWVAHDRLHLRQLAGTMARLWAARWVPLKSEYAGPIPYEPGASAPA
jgi:hypothetical protein